MYIINRTDGEIDDVMNRCANQTDRGGSAYHGMTYEEGISDAINWLTGDDPEPLFDD